MIPESIILNTQDDVDIAADWYRVKDLKRFAILLHQRSLTKESWKAWCEALTAQGISCLAIDERGSGGSTSAGEIDYRQFTDEDYKKRSFDVDAAFEWLRVEEGATEENTILIGASVGANLAIRFMADHPGVKFCVVLSPSRNYFGITTEDAIKKLSAGQKLIMVASDDDNSVVSECRELNMLAPDRSVAIEKKGLGHGVAMTDKDPGLLSELVGMIK